MSLTLICGHQFMQIGRRPNEWIWFVNSDALLFSSNDNHKKNLSLSLALNRRPGGYQLCEPVHGDFGDVLVDQ